MVVRKAARMAWQLNVPIVGLVENMSYFVCPKCGEQVEVFGASQAMQTALQLGVPLLGRLPLDSDLARRCDAGEVELYPAELFAPIAEEIAERASAQPSTPIF